MKTRNRAERLHLDALKTTQRANNRKLKAKRPVEDRGRLIRHRNEINSLWDMAAEALAEREAHQS